MAKYEALGCTPEVYIDEREVLPMGDFFSVSSFIATIVSLFVSMVGVKRRRMKGTTVDVSVRIRVKVADARKPSKRKR